MNHEDLLLQSTQPNAIVLGAILCATRRTDCRRGFASADTRNKLLVVQLATGDYPGSRENILLDGPNGTGKSHLAISLAIYACSQGKHVRFWRVRSSSSGLVKSSRLMVASSAEPVQ